MELISIYPVAALHFKKAFPRCNVSALKTQQCGQQSQPCINALLAQRNCDVIRAREMQITVPSVGK